MVRRIALMTALIFAACLLFASCEKKGEVLDYYKLVEACENAGVTSMDEMQDLLDQLYAGKMLSVEGWAVHSRSYMYKHDEWLRLSSNGDQWHGSLLAEGSLEPDTPEYTKWNEIDEFTHCVVEGKVKRFHVGIPSIYDDDYPDEWKFNVRDVEITIRLESISSFSEIYEDSEPGK